MPGHMEEYIYVSTIGEGTYGYVWKCQEHSTGRVVAIKAFKAAHVDPDIKRMALREVRMLQDLSHPAIISLLDAFRSKSGRVYMVFPYMPRSAYHALDEHPDGLPAHQLKLLAWQLLQALSYLHARKVVHRDIKPSNILMSHSGEVRLCDFGFARPTHCDAHGAEPMSPYVITRWYRPPEVLTGGEYGPSADVWSLGCTLAELATGMPLFQGKSTLDQLWRILRCFGSLPPAQSARAACDPRLRPLRTLPLGGRCLRQRLPACEPGLVQLLEACLQPDPARRCTAEQLLQSPYFWAVPRLIAGSMLELAYGKAMLAAAAAQAATSPPGVTLASQAPQCEQSRHLYGVLPSDAAPLTPSPSAAGVAAASATASAVPAGGGGSACDTGTHNGAGASVLRNALAEGTGASTTASPRPPYPTSNTPQPSDSTRRCPTDGAAADRDHGSMHAFARALSGSSPPPAAPGLPARHPWLLDATGGAAAEQPPLRENCTLTPTASAATAVSSTAAAAGGTGDGSRCASSVHMHICDTAKFDIQPSTFSVALAQLRAGPGAPLPLRPACADDNGGFPSALVTTPSCVVRKDSALCSEVSCSQVQVGTDFGTLEPPVRSSTATEAAAAPVARQGGRRGATTGGLVGALPPAPLSRIQQLWERSFGTQRRTAVSMVATAAPPRAESAAADAAAAAAATGCGGPVGGGGDADAQLPQQLSRHGALQKRPSAPPLPRPFFSDLSVARLYGKPQLQPPVLAQSQSRLQALRAEGSPTPRFEFEPHAEGSENAKLDEPPPRRFGGSLPGVPTQVLDASDSRSSDPMGRTAMADANRTAEPRGQPAWVAAGFSSVPTQRGSEDGNACGDCAPAAPGGDVTVAAVSVLVAHRTSSSGSCSGSIHSGHIAAAVRRSGSGRAASGKVIFARSRFFSQADRTMSGPCEVGPSSTQRDARHGGRTDTVGPAVRASVCVDGQPRQLLPPRQHTLEAAVPSAMAAASPDAVAASPPPVARPFLPGPSPSLAGSGAYKGCDAAAASVRPPTEEETRASVTAQATYVEATPIVSTNVTDLLHFWCTGANGDSVCNDSVACGSAGANPAVSTVALKREGDGQRVRVEKKLTKRLRGHITRLLSALKEAVTHVRQGRAEHDARNWRGA